MNALVRAENAADDDAAFDLVIAHLERFQFDLAVAEQDRIAIFDRRGQARKVDRNGELRAQNFARR